MSLTSPSGKVLTRYSLISTSSTRIPIILPSSQPSDISVADHTFSGASLISIAGLSMNSRTGNYVVRHRKEFFNQQGQSTSHAQRLER